MSKIRTINGFAIHSDTPVFKRPRYTSKYRELFNAMKKGEWFYVKKEDYYKFNGAGSTYLKGRYSLRRAGKGRSYIFQKTA